MTVSYVVSGFAVGLIVGLTGVGGGSLMTPLLPLLFGIHPSVAVGTDLAFASVTKVGGTVAHRWRGTVRWDIVKRLSLGALPAAIATALIPTYLGGISAEIGQIIRYSIAVSVLLTVIALLFKGNLHRWLNAHLEKRLQGNNLALATVVAYAVPLTAIAALGHWWLGSIDWSLLGSLLLGSVPGITLGSLAARAIPEKFLRGLLAVTLTTVAVKLIY